MNLWNHFVLNYFFRFQCLIHVNFSKISRNLCFFKRITLFLCLCVLLRSFECSKSVISNINKFINRLFERLVTFINCSSKFICFIYEFDCIVLCSNYSGKTFLSVYQHTLKFILVASSCKSLSVKTIDIISIISRCI